MQSICLRPSAPPGALPPRSAPTPRQRLPSRRPPDRAATPHAPPGADESLRRNSTLRRPARQAPSAAVCGAAAPTHLTSALFSGSTLYFLACLVLVRPRLSSNLLGLHRQRDVARANVRPASAHNKEHLVCVAHSHTHCSQCNAMRPFQALVWTHCQLRALHGVQCVRTHAPLLYVDLDPSEHSSIPSNSDNPCAPWIMAFASLHQTTPTTPSTLEHPTPLCLPGSIPSPLNLTTNLFSNLGNCTPVRADAGCAALARDAATDADGLAVCAAGRRVRGAARAVLGAGHPGAHDARQHPGWAGRCAKPLFEFTVSILGGARVARRQRGWLGRLACDSQVIHCHPFRSLVNTGALGPSIDWLTVAVDLGAAALGPLSNRVWCWAALPSCGRCHGCSAS